MPASVQTLVIDEDAEGRSAGGQTKTPRWLGEASGDMSQHARFHTFSVPSSRFYGYCVIFHNHPDSIASHDACVHPNRAYGKPADVPSAQMHARALMRPSCRRADSVPIRLDGQNLVRE